MGEPMRLETALELKDELRTLIPSFLRQRGGPPPPTPPIIAVGISPAAFSEDYRIAIRPRFETDIAEPVASLIRSTTAGEVDIRVTGPIAPFGRRLTIGASTSHQRGCTGTIGFFARPVGGGPVGFVSNNHVIAAEDDGVEGDTILHPGRADGGGEVAGYLVGGYPRLRGTGARTVDCAFARLADGVDFDAASLSTGGSLNASPVDPADAREVWKIGRSTKLTRGRVTAIAMDDVVVDYRFGSARFTGQFEIESIDEKPFSTSGDSGALIFTDDHHPVGLIFAGSAAGGRTNSGLTYANPIAAVLSELRITLE